MVRFRLLCGDFFLQNPAPYLDNRMTVCMEPWNGWANSVNEEGRHEVLEPDEAMTSEWSITIEKV